MSNFKNDAKRIVEYIGKDNIISSSHCQTRIRIIVKEHDKVNVDEINKLPTVTNSIFSQGQYQIIIGLKVGELYKELEAELNEEETTKPNKSDVVAVSNKENWFKKFMGIFSEIFTGIIPVIVAGGLIVAIRNILQVDWKPNGSGYVLADNVSFLNGLSQILWLPANAIFWYLPVHIVWSSFNRRNEAPVLGIVIGIMLVSPGILVSYKDVLNGVGKIYIENDFIHNGSAIINGGIYSMSDLSLLLGVPLDSTLDDISNILIDDGVENWYLINTVWDSIKANDAYFFNGWPLAISYVGQVIPSLMVGLFSVSLFVFLKEKCPGSLKYFLPSLLTIIIVLFIAHGLLAPIGLLLSQVINYILTIGFTNDVTKWIVGPAFAFAYPFIVLLGIQHLLNAIMLDLTNFTIFAETGSNYIFPILAISNMTQGASVIGLVIFYRNENPKKTELLTSGVNCFMGVTEPALFGANIKYVFPFLAAAIATSISGLFIVAFDITAFGIGVGGILGVLNINAIFGNDKVALAWIVYLIIMIVAMLLSSILTIVFAKNEKWFDKHVKVLPSQELRKGR